MFSKLNLSIVFKFVFLFIGSVIFMIIGYYLSAVKMLQQLKGYSMKKSIISAVSSPFSSQFNDLSAIYMLGGVIVFFAITITVIVIMNKFMQNKEDSLDTDIIDNISLDECNYLGKKETVSDFDLFNERIIGNNSSVNNIQHSQVNDDSFVSLSDINIKEPIIHTEELRFSDEITNELLGAQYSLDQLVAMVEIKRYIQDISADMLMKMFSKDMTASEINSYITLFYE